MPDPSVVRCICPIAIGIQVLGAPNIFIVVLNVVAKSLSQVALAIVDPFIQRVFRQCRRKFPITSVVAVNYELCRSTVT
jgi:hypothetical protein